MDPECRHFQKGPALRSQQVSQGQSQPGTTLQSPAPRGQGHGAPDSTQVQNVGLGPAPPAGLCMALPLASLDLGRDAPPRGWRAASRWTRLMPPPPSHGDGDTREPAPGPLARPTSQGSPTKKGPRAWAASCSPRSQSWPECELRCTTSGTPASNPDHSPLILSRGPCLKSRPWSPDVKPPPPPQGPPVLHRALAWPSVGWLGHLGGPQGRLYPEGPRTVFQTRCPLQDKASAPSCLPVPYGLHRRFGALSAAVTARCPLCLSLRGHAPGFRLGGHSPRASKAMSRPFPPPVPSPAQPEEQGPGQHRKHPPPLLCPRPRPWGHLPLCPSGSLTRGRFSGRTPPLTSPSLSHMKFSQPSSGGASGMNSQSAPEARADTSARYLGDGQGGGATAEGGHPSTAHG